MKKSFIVIIFFQLWFTGLTQKTPVYSSIQNNGFYENKGQITDQNYQPNPAVKYLLCSAGVNIQLRQTGFSYDTYTIEIQTEALSKTMHGKFKEPTPFTMHYHRVDVELQGCNANAEIIAEGQSKEYFNYFTAGTPQNGVSYVHKYKTVTYRNIYPYIDLVFYAEGKEYNFVVHPGGKVSDIQLAYKGANDVALKNNELTIRVAGGDFTEDIPKSYIKNTKQKVQVNYTVLGKNIYGFSIQHSTFSIQHSDLVIDPVPTLVWGTYYGGTIFDEANAIILDSAGNSYITGQAGSTNGIATSGAYQDTASGNVDVFIAKFNPTGSALLWGTYYGGTGEDDGYAITLDKNTNVLVSGLTKSATKIATPGGYQSAYAGNGDAFVAEFNPTGSSLLWGTYYGGASGEEEGYGIQIDNTGVYVVGGTSSSSGIATPGVHQTIYGGGGDAFLAKFNLTGNSLVWGTYYGGTGDDYIQGLVLDSANDIYVTGQSASDSGITTTGALKSINTSGNPDIFLSKFNSSGSLVWGTYYGGSGAGYSVVLDKKLNLYITGITNSHTGIATSGAYKTSFGDNNLKAFVSKISSDGSALLWGTYFGGSGGEARGIGIVIDSIDNLYITGFTNCHDSIATNNAWEDTIPNGAAELAFLAKFDSTAQLRWGTYYGGYGAEAMAVKLDKNDNMYITGNAGNGGIATPGAYQTSSHSTFSNPSSNAFVAKFDSTEFDDINELKVENGEFKIWPNPSNGKFAIEITNYELGITNTVVVYNMLGEKVYSNQFSNVNSQFSIDLSNEPQGIYMYRISTTKGEVVGSGKLIIE